ncbi:MAG: DUF3422 domain-containing protein [Alphaproteobacteria bacterium]|nr:DUF3422 domain-containing protein [Alphaproteobacteria bacterium]
MPMAIVGEGESQLFGPIAGPRRLLHFGFATSADAAAADRARLEALCISLGQPTPRPDLKHHQVDLGDARLHWEQQNEFTAYTWEVAGVGSPFSTSAGARSSAMRLVERPGALLVSIDLHVMPGAAGIQLDQIFGGTQVAVSRLEGGAAIVATDFRPDEEGFVRILISHANLSPARAGAIVQRLLEIETYRALALLGPPEAQRLDPIVKSAENALTRITQSMTQVRGPNADRGLLEEITGLAATLEQESTNSAHRFGATRAYDKMVQQRLESLGEQTVPGFPTFAALLARRLGPPMLSCQIIEERMKTLAERLDRATELLRTRTNVQIEHQNRDLMTAMTERSRLQLRLQHVIEFVALAAVSYYFVALVQFVFQGIAGDKLLLKVGERLGMPINLDSNFLTAVAVPIVFLVVWFLLRRIRKKHAERQW